MKKTILVLAVISIFFGCNTKPKADLNYTHFRDGVEAKEVFYSTIDGGKTHKYILLFGVTDSLYNWKNDTVFIGDKDLIIKSLYKRMKIAESMENALSQQLYTVNGLKVPEGYIVNTKICFGEKGSFKDCIGGDSITKIDYYLKYKYLYDSLYNIKSKIY